MSKSQFQCQQSTPSQQVMMRQQRSVRHHSRRSLSNLGSSINLSVERFVTVSEYIVDDETRSSMFTACHEARVSAGAIEKLCNSEDTSLIIPTGRNLLAAVTRVLLLSDNILVKQLIGDKVPSQLDSVKSFIEFVHAFSSFGTEMLELSYFESKNEGRDLRLRQQLDCASNMLQKSTNILITAAKTHQMHSSSSGAREIRDTVFCQMRRAVDLIHFIVKESIISSDLIQQRKSDGNIHSYLLRFQQIENCRKGSSSEEMRELPRVLERIMERIQDFTDSAYTRHEHRENILLLCDRLKLQLNQLLRIGLSNLQMEGDSGISDEFETTTEGIINSVLDLMRQLELTTFLQANDLQESSEEYENLIQILRNSALIMDNDRLDEIIEIYYEYIEHVQEVSRLLYHISPTEPLNVRSKYIEINLKIYGSLVPLASKLLASFPTSKLARQNLDALISLLHSLIQETAGLAQEVQVCCSGRKEYYMSLPKRGKHGTTQKPLLKASTTTQSTSTNNQVDDEDETLPSSAAQQQQQQMQQQQQDEDEMSENNDILRRAKLLSGMAENMYEFTRGGGECRTTQDLFTQAEYFAEEANRLYKVVRQFSYMVPTGIEKKSLLEKVDEVPTRVQQLQFLVKNPTVGKAATFTKVDSVISETKSLMDVISTVVGICFNTATKYTLSTTNEKFLDNNRQYKLDFSTVSPRRSGIYNRSDSEELLGNTNCDGSKSGGGSGGDSS